MTALPDWDITGPTDADLAGASAVGDRRAFAGIYDRYADRLYDFCIGMLADRDDAADCVQDVFCIAATRLSQLREPDKLRPWLYSIARNEALRRIRERGRETPSHELPDTASSDPGPDTLAARTELADLIADAAGGLSDRDRSVLELAFRHGLNGPDLADALGVSHSNANTIVHRLRETVERSLGALLVARRVRAARGCEELATILDGWDGHFNVLMRKRVSRHIASCEACERERQRLVSPVALLGAAPVLIPAPEWLRDRTLDQIQLVSFEQTYQPQSPDNAPAETIAGPAEDVGTDRRRGMTVPVSLFAAALIAVVTLTVVWLNQNKVAITPTEVTGPQPASTSPVGNSPSAPPPPATVHTPTPASALPSPTSKSQPPPATGEPPVSERPLPPAPPPVSEQPAPVPPAPPPVPPAPMPSVPAWPPIWLPSLPAPPPPAPAPAPRLVNPAPEPAPVPAITSPPVVLAPPLVTLTPPVPTR